MEFPMLKPIPTTRQMLDVFGGYDRRPRPAEGTFARMKNMSSRHYPLLAPREKRGRRHFYYEGDYNKKLLGYGYCCGFCYALEDGTFHFDAYSQGGISQFLDPNSRKTFLPMGGRMLIFPDKKWVSCAELAKTGSLENVYGGLESRWEGTCTCTSGDGLVTCTGTGIGAGFLVGDVAKIRLANRQEEKWTTQNIWFSRVERVEENSITVLQNPDYPITDQAEKYLIISRKLPEMDLVIECGNRIWGCRYGLNTDGKFVNAIYCSKLGDPSNWKSFQGVSTDSWEVSIGADGPFTGAATYLGKPVFFKENTILTVYGSYPAQFQLKTVDAPGVRPGCAGSLAVVEDKLYYLGRDGVYAYDGALPVPVARELGSISGDQVGAGGHNGKYYLSCPEGLLVYDVRQGLWHREDAAQFSSFLSVEGKLYALTRDGMCLSVLADAREMDGSNTWETVDTEAVSWLAETGPLGLETPDAKRITALTLRLWMDRGSKLKVFVRYDFDRDWECVATLTARDLGSRRIPIHPKRCDHMYLRLEGEGDFRLYSITKTLQEGSELH